MSSEFQVGQQFKVPGITWTITDDVIGVHGRRRFVIEANYADGRRAEFVRTPDELAWIIRRAKELGRLIEHPKPQEKSENV